MARRWGSDSAPETNGSAMIRRARIQETGGVTGERLDARVGQRPLNRVEAQQMGGTTVVPWGH